MIKTMIAHASETAPIVLFVLLYLLCRGGEQCQYCVRMKYDRVVWIVVRRRSNKKLAEVSAAEKKVVSAEVVISRAVGDKKIITLLSSAAGFVRATCGGGYRSYSC